MRPGLDDGKVDRLAGDLSVRAVPLPPRPHRRCACLPEGVVD
jgi:hypothetical protein